MSTIQLFPGNYYPPDGTASNLPAEFKRIKSSASAPTPYFGQLNYDAAQKEQAHFQFTMPDDYGTDLTLVVHYKAASATTGGVAFEYRQGAITADVDTTDMDAKAYSTANVATDTVPAVAGRVAIATVAISAADSVAAEDEVLGYLCRDFAHASDTATGDIEVTGVYLTYTPA